MPSAKPDAANLASHKGDRGDGQPPWWNEEDEKAWLDKRQAVKTGRSQPELLKGLKDEVDEKTKLFKSSANQVKAAKWDEFC